MKKGIGIIVIHGVGSQRVGFSADMVEELSNRLGDFESRVEWQEIHWANVLKQREDVLWQEMSTARDSDGNRLDLDWVKIRKFVVHNIGDALAYHRNYEKASAYTEIHKTVSTSLDLLYAKLSDPSSPIVVLAHSLGGQIMSNYIWDRQHEKDGQLTPIDNLISMVTFGCNIPLFSLDFSVARPIRLPGKGITTPALKKVSKWLNFYDRDDVLGWPLRPLYEKNRAKLLSAQKATVSRIEDDEINVGSITTGWNPASHNSYWTDNDLTKPLARYLKNVVRALDK